VAPRKSSTERNPFTGVPRDATTAFSRDTIDTPRKRRDFERAPKKFSVNTNGWRSAVNSNSQATLSRRLSLVKASRSSNETCLNKGVS
jgi:hypothetical protein